MRILKALEKVLVLIFIFLSIAFAVYAQAPPPSNNIPGVPLDSVVAALLAFGVGYGASKLKKKES